MSRVLLIVALLAMVAAFATGIAVAATTTSPGTSADTINIAGPPTSTSTMAATWTTTPLRDFDCTLAEVAAPPAVARSHDNLAVVTMALYPEPASATNRTAEVSPTPEAVARSTSYVVVDTGTLRSTCFGTNGSTITIGQIISTSANSTTGLTANISAATGKIEYDAYKMTYRAPAVG